MSAYRPTAYMPLYIQQPAAIQRGLFATSVEPRTEPPCDHPETQRQRRLGAPDILDDVCVVCGAVVSSEDESCGPCGRNGGCDLPACHFGPCRISRSAP